MGGPLIRGSQNLNFLIPRARHIKFSKLANIKIKFEKIWEYQKVGPIYKRGRQDSNFLTTHAGQMKFSKSINIL